MKCKEVIGQTLSLVLIIVALCDGFNTGEKLAFTEKSHPMLASIFSTAHFPNADKALQGHTNLNIKRPHTGILTGSNNKGPHKAIIPSFAAMTCRLCQISKNETCIRIHCWNDGILAMGEPISLPQSLIEIQKAETNAAFGTSSNNIPHTNVHASNNRFVSSHGLHTSGAKAGGPDISQISSNVPEFQSTGTAASNNWFVTSGGLKTSGAKAGGPDISQISSNVPEFTSTGTVSSLADSVVGHLQIKDVRSTQNNGIKAESANNQQIAPNNAWDVVMRQQPFNPPVQESKGIISPLPTHGTNAIIVVKQQEAAIAKGPVNMSASVVSNNQHIVSSLADNLFNRQPFVTGTNVQQESVQLTENIVKNQQIALNQKVTVFNHPQENIITDTVVRQDPVHMVTHTDTNTHVSANIANNLAENVFNHQQISNVPDTVRKDPKPFELNIDSSQHIPSNVEDNTINLQQQPRTEGTMFAQKTINNQHVASNVADNMIHQPDSNTPETMVVQDTPWFTQNTIGSTNLLNTWSFFAPPQASKAVNLVHNNDISVIPGPIPRVSSGNGEGSSFILGSREAAQVNSMPVSQGPILSVPLDTGPGNIQMVDIPAANMPEVFTPDQPTTTPSITTPLQTMSPARKAELREISKLFLPQLRF